LTNLFYTYIRALHNAKLSIMPIKKISIILFFIAITAFSSLAQPTVPKGFIETTPPKVGADSWLILNNSKKEFVVKNEKGRLVVRVGLASNKGELQMSNGKLVGIDNGEWGGGLSFVPTDTTQSQKKIIRGNIRHIFRFQGNIYFIHGIAHMSISEGTLYRLDTLNQTFVYTKILDFEDAPEAYAVYDNKILIAAHESFYVVNDFKKQQIVKEAFWSSLYPNSIAAFDNNNIFIGMRGGIVKLGLLTGSFKFYKFTPKKS
jgi:hypothetical protein